MRRLPLHLAVPLVLAACGDHSPPTAPAMVLASVQKPAIRVTNLGVLPGGCRNGQSYAYALNRRGPAPGSLAIVGASMVSSCYLHAFSWTSVGGMVDLIPNEVPDFPLAASGAYGVSDGGLIVGIRHAGSIETVEAVVWNAPGTAPMPLPIPTWATAANFAGSVTPAGTAILGQARLSDGTFQSVLWRLASGDWKVVDAFSAQVGNGAAGLAADGLTVVGSTATSDPAIWQETSPGTWTMSVLEGGPGKAGAISPGGGFIAGGKGTPNVPMLWTRSSGWKGQVLASLGSGYSCSTSDVNDTGIVVGSCQSTGPTYTSRAVAWIPSAGSYGLPTDLGGLTSAKVNTARAINNYNQIVGTSNPSGNGSNGLPRAVMWELLN